MLLFISIILTYLFSLITDLKSQERDDDYVEDEKQKSREG